MVTATASNRAPGAGWNELERWQWTKLETEMASQEQMRQRRSSPVLFGSMLCQMRLSYAIAVPAFTGKLTWFGIFSSLLVVLPSGANRCHVTNV